jgi:hypothetical protein
MFRGLDTVICPGKWVAGQFESTIVEWQTIQELHQNAELKTILRVEDELVTHGNDQ